jgi:hypothetical protein
MTRAKLRRASSRNRVTRTHSGRCAGWPAQLRRYVPLNDDFRPSAGDYSLDLRLLGLGHSELVECLLEIVEKSLPLYRSYHEMSVGLLHGAARVLLRPASGPADHFSDEVLEASRGNAVMGLVYLWVCIQAGIDHDPVDEVVHYGGDAVDTTEPVVERGLVRAVSHLNATAFPKEGRKLLKEFDLVVPCHRALHQNGAVDPGSASMAFGDRPQQLRARLSSVRVERDHLAPRVTFKN